MRAQLHIHIPTTTHTCTHIQTYMPCIHTYAHTYICIQTYIYTYIHTYTHTHTYIHTHIHIHAYKHTYTHMHTCIYIQTHIQVHTYTHTHTYVHTYIHAYRRNRIATGKVLVIIAFFGVCKRNPACSAHCGTNWFLMTRLLSSSGTSHTAWRRSTQQNVSSFAGYNWLKCSQHAYVAPSKVAEYSWVREGCEGAGKR